MNEYLDENNFIYHGTMYYRADNGRCYTYVDAAAGGRLDKAGLYASRRVSAPVFETLRHKCKGGAA